ncbi:hypothetical protein SAMN05444372_101346 [Flavobacterium micromati]|uniref:DUF3575 domain-containing protein n=1 Tax=Flavobacterium micromati TaxID=229205 RepID=A0A1M5FX99_9FLAO|nr:DUF3575 domain-containing protein [Flavobacterium micromati]SHF96165.1 hypothetical protein SAMN05444372_101346 [Flavobacterium micromati]
MKKLFIVLCLSSFLIGFSQQKDTTDFKRNELKGNTLFLILGNFEASYERILSKESGIGVAISKPFDKDQWNINYALTAYYRYYFGKKVAAGFFVERFSMINTGISHVSYRSDNNGNLIIIDKDRFTDFALGFGLGSKWVHKRGFTFEINAGIGRNLFSDESPEVVGRGGITLGYRF